MKRFMLLIAVAFATVSLVGCSNKTTLEDLQLDTMTGKEILLGIADGSIVPDGYSVSVYDDELVIITDDGNLSVAMPEDEFYLSVAPYVSNTHECTYHSATGCRGEIKNKTVYVEFVTEDGTEVLSQEMTTLSNGFIDLWLPRNVSGTLTITVGELSSSTNVTTNPGDKTCETTMLLT